MTLIFSLVIGAVLIASSLVLLLSRKQESKQEEVAVEKSYIAEQVCSKVQNSELIVRSLPLLQKGYSEESIKAISDIKALKDYDQDPNCMFIITTLYANTNQFVKAREALAHLKIIYVSNEVIQKWFGPYAQTLEEVGTYIINSEKIVESQNNQVRIIE